MSDLELSVSPRFQEGCARAHDLRAGHVGKPAQDFPHADHLAGPLFVALVLQPLLL